jgi:CDP-diacylglycerol--serine O-phosphatidyltransferase
MSIKSKIVQNIPNFITILNLVSGAIGVLFVFEDKILWACIMIYFAGLFDFLDGLAARILKATSEIGKSLDSLADVVSFGFLPTAIIFYIIKMIIMKSNPAFSVLDASFTEILLLSTSLFIVAFAALRLANFNTDTRQTYGFIGVPTPSVAILISSFPFIIAKSGWESELLMKLYIIIPVVFILSFLMVSEISMISLKFKSLSFKENAFKYLLIIVSVIAILIGGIASIPVIFLVYIVFSVLESKFSVPHHQ